MGEEWNKCVFYGLQRAELVEGKKNPVVDIGARLEVWDSHHWRVTMFAGSCVAANDSGSRLYPSVSHWCRKIPVVSLLLLEAEGFWVRDNGPYSQSFGSHKYFLLSFLCRLFPFNQDLSIQSLHIHVSPTTAANPSPFLFWTDILSFSPWTSLGELSVSIPRSDIVLPFCRKSKNISSLLCGCREKQIAISWYMVFGLSRGKGGKIMFPAYRKSRGFCC